MNIPTDRSAVLRLAGAGSCVAMVVVPGPEGTEAGMLFYNGSEDHRVRWRCNDEALWLCMYTIELGREDGESKGADVGRRTRARCWYLALQVAKRACG
jgi:hypothetical protein